MAQGGNKGVGLSRGTATRIADKEKVVALAAEEHERKNRKKSRGKARPIIKAAYAIAATGMVTKAESDTPAGILAAGLIGIQSLEREAAGRLDQDASAMQRQLSLLGAQKRVMTEMLGGALYALDDDAGPKDEAAAVALVAEAYVSGLVDQMLTHHDSSHGG